jgi:phosphoribosylanthranilate isomerase
MKVKICGITNITDALLCQNAGADALGFIFYQKSPRYISSDEAAKITKRLSPFTVKAGVFVDEDINTVRNIFYKANLNVVQLHGSETPEYVKELNLPVIKSFRVHDDFDFGILDKYENALFLLDAHSAKAQGGTGDIFNWNLIPQKLRNSIILAGGVSAENIDRIINEINPLAVDLSSSVESAPGKKDEQKTETFFKKLKQARRIKWL